VTAGCAVVFMGLILAVRFLRPQLTAAFDDPVHVVAEAQGNAGTVPPAPAGSAV